MRGHKYVSKPFTTIKWQLNSTYDTFVTVLPLSSLYLFPLFYILAQLLKFWLLLLDVTDCLNRNVGMSHSVQHQLVQPTDWTEKERKGERERLGETAWVWRWGCREKNRRNKGEKQLNICKTVRGSGGGGGGRQSASSETESSYIKMVAQRDSIWWQHEK